MAVMVMVMVVVVVVQVMTGRPSPRGLGGKLRLQLIGVVALAIFSGSMLLSYISPPLSSFLFPFPYDLLLLLLFLLFLPSFLSFYCVFL